MNNKFIFKFITITIFTILIYPHFSNTASAQSTATLYLTPATQSQAVNSTVNVDIMVNTGGADITNVGAIINYSTNNLTLVGLSYTNSVFGVHEENNTTGIINTTTYNSGGTTFNGIGIVARITFRISSEGTANLIFSNSSTVMNADPSPINILSGTTPATITGTPAGTLPATGLLDSKGTDYFTISFYSTISLLLICFGLIGIIKYQKYSNLHKSDKLCSKF